MNFFTAQVGAAAPLLGIEILIVGLLVWGLGSAFHVRALRGYTEQPPLLRFTNLLLLEFAALPYVVAGVALLLGYSWGLYWIAAGVLFSVVKAVSDSWVLLVEIKR